MKRTICFYCQFYQAFLTQTWLAKRDDKIDSYSKFNRPSTPKGHIDSKTADGNIVVKLLTIVGKRCGNWDLLVTHTVITFKGSSRMPPDSFLGTVQC